MNKVLTLKIIDTEGKISYIEVNSFESLVHNILNAEAVNSTYKVFEEVNNETQDKINDTHDKIITNLRANRYQVK